MSMATLPVALTFEHHRITTGLEKSFRTAYIGSVTAQFISYEQGITTETKIELTAEEEQELVSFMAKIWKSRGKEKGA